MAPNIVDSVPMIKYFVYKLKEQLGEISKGEVESSKQFKLPEFSIESGRDRSSTLPKAYFWSVGISNKPAPGSERRGRNSRSSNGLTSPVAFPHD